jgi:ABC-type glycerol-3-phosphate transport system permease component
MILPIAGQTAFATLLFRQFYVQLPAGLIEAARIDGANWPRVLTSIAVPLAKPAIAAYCSISFLTAWNTYIWPQIVAPDRQHQLLTGALAPLAQSKFTIYPPNIGLAAAVLTIIPVLLLFVAFQRWFINGVVGTGIE